MITIADIFPKTRNMDIAAGIVQSIIMETEKAYNNTVPVTIYFHHQNQTMTLSTHTQKYALYVIQERPL